MSKTLKLPKAIEAQKTRVDALINDMKVVPAGQTVEPPAPVTEDPVTTEPIPDSTPPTPVVKPELVDGYDAAYWNHRFKSAEGMFNVHKKELNDRTAALENEIRELKNKLSETTNQIPKEYDLRKYLSEEDINAYGEPMLKAILKTAAKMSQEQIDSKVESIVESRITPMKKEIESTTQQSIQNRETIFWADINRNVPSWQQVNADKQFHVWLSEKEGLSGFTRQQLLSNAQVNLDSGLVTEIFNAFLKTRDSARSSVQQRIEKKIIPESIPSSTASVTSNEVEYIPKSVIRKFYDDKKLGRYANRPEEAKALEKKINAAYLAGRVSEG